MQGNLVTIADHLTGYIAQTRLECAQHPLRILNCNCLVCLKSHSNLSIEWLTFHPVKPTTKTNGIHDEASWMRDL